MHVMSHVKMIVLRAYKHILHTRHDIVYADSEEKRREQTIYVVGNTKLLYYL